MAAVHCYKQKMNRGTAKFGPPCNYLLSSLQFVQFLCQSMARDGLNQAFVKRFILHLLGLDDATYSDKQRIFIPFNASD